MTEDCCLLILHKESPLEDIFVTLNGENKEQLEIPTTRKTTVYLSKLGLGASLLRGLVGKLWATHWSSPGFDFIIVYDQRRNKNVRSSCVWVFRSSNQVEKNKRSKTSWIPHAYFKSLLNSQSEVVHSQNPTNVSLMTFTSNIFVIKVKYAFLEESWAISDKSWPSHFPQ